MVKFYCELLKQNKIGVYPSYSNKKEEYIIPDNYYINPDGLLYNDIGDLNSIYSLIKESFYKDSVSLEELLINELTDYKRIVTANTITLKDIKKYLNLKCDETNNPLLKDLIMGTVSSRIILLENFIKLKNNCKNKKIDMTNIINQSNDDISDILVRFCGFHKMNVKDRIITTTSLDKDIFNKYLDNYYIINNVSKISLDNYVLVENKNFLDKLHVLVNYQKKLKKAK